VIEATQHKFTNITCDIIIYPTNKKLPISNREGLAAQNANFAPKLCCNGNYQLQILYLSKNFFLTKRKLSKG